MPAPPARAVDAALALRRRLLAAADAVLPPWAAMFDRTIGILRTHVLAALVEVGVPDALADGPLSLDELASRVGAHADTLRRLLRVAELDGIVARDRHGRYKLTRMGKVLRTDAPGSLGAWTQHLVLESTRAAYAELPGTLRTGESSFRRARGMHVWDWYADHPEEEALFATAMRNITSFEADGLAQASLWPDSGTVCDVAGGTGHLLSAVLAARPGLRGVLIDLPAVVAAARERLAGHDRIEFVDGDLFNTLDIPADVYVLKNILHDWDDPTCATIISNVRAAMRPGSRLLVIEQLQPEDVPQAFASTTDIQMLTQTDGGRERSAAELQALLSRAGLRPGQVERVGVPALIEGLV